MDDVQILIDPFILAIPLGSEERPAYVAGLVDWLRVLVRNRQRCSLSEASLGELMSSGRYPTGTAIRQILHDRGISEISVVDVLNVLRPVSEVEPFLEQRVGIQAVIGEEWAFDPAGMVTRLGEGLGTAFRDGVLMAVAAQGVGWASDGLIVATADVQQRHGYVSARISVFERPDGDLEEINKMVAGEFEIANRPDLAESDLGLEDVYSDAARAAAVAYRSEAGATDEAVFRDRVRVGGEFIPSLEALEIHRSPGLLRAVYRRVALAAVGELHLVEGARLHPVRVNADADAQQVTRADGGKLWRCMVTKKGAGYRLHYWTLSESRIELDRLLTEGQI